MSLLGSIGNLAALTGLYLAQNQLTSIPESIGNPGGLTLLAMQQNQLTSIPATLKHLF